MRRSSNLFSKQAQKGGMFIVVILMLFVTSFFAATLLSRKPSPSVAHINQIATHAALRLIKSNILTIVISQSGGSNTAALNCAADPAAELCCLVSGALCTSPTTQANPAIWNPAGGVYYDPKDATAGFDINGQPCTGYPPTRELAASLQGCLFHPSLSILVRCATAASCDSPPEAKLTVTFTGLTIAPGVIANPNLYSGANGAVEFE